MTSSPVHPTVDRKKPATSECDPTWRLARRVSDTENCHSSVPADGGRPWCADATGGDSPGTVPSRQPVLRPIQTMQNHLVSSPPQQTILHLSPGSRKAASRARHGRSIHFSTAKNSCVTLTCASLSYIVIFAKISLQRLNALSIAAAGVIPFLITSAWAWPQSCSESHWPQAGENAL